MPPPPRQLPQPRPIEIAPTDHVVRSYGGQTTATDMEPTRMKHSKKRESLTEYIDYLVRREGGLRLEASHYRAMAMHAEIFKLEVESVAHELLSSYIHGLLNDSSFEDVKRATNALVDALNKFQASHEKEVDAYLSPYKAYHEARSKRQTF